MQRLEGRLVYAASDLNDYLECKRLSELEELVARGRRERPEPDDPRAELLRRKGDEHEHRYLESMLALYPGEVTEFRRSCSGIEAYLRAEQETLEAMRRGARIIYQATFFDGLFIGHADFLRRVETPSNLGDYSYEVVDTKLGLAAKPYYLVQLCNYSEHLERIQGRMPEFGRVLFGNGEMKRFRLHQYLAYYRHLKRTFLDFVSGAARNEADEPREYPFECKHCAICPWNELCEQRRREDDHLSLVAWIRSDQVMKLEAAGIGRVAELAQATDEMRPAGMSPETFRKLRRQASLQVRGRASAQPIYELLPRDPSLGFEVLPQPDAGDVFFDMEGDPHFEPGRGLEYLFGCWIPADEPKFRAFWGVDRIDEKRAFEGLVDFITQRRRHFPAMHVYHYAGYEKDALRRLAQRHATRETEIDDLLRGEVLVDLFVVVRRAIAISEERYGLKNLERFYQLRRDTIVKKGDDSIVRFETWLLERDPKVLDDIERYNRDDCRSTQMLRDWLLERRIEAMTAFGVDLPLRAAKSPDQPCHADFVESCAKCVGRRNDEREETRRSALERSLLDGVLVPQSEEEYRLMAPDRRMRYLLGNLMAYHRREEKPAWWAFFDRCDNVDQLHEFDKEAIAGLKLREDIEPYRAAKSMVYTYEFPDQVHKMAAGDTAVDPRTKRSGSILALDDEVNLLEFKTTASIDGARDVRELIPSGPPPTKEQRKALARIAGSFLEGKLAGAHPATYDLLSNGDPRVHDRDAASNGLQPQYVTAETVSAVVSALDRSYLFIQGPPGSGKSTIGSRVICDLLASGKRVAVTAMSHKAIHNLLDKVERCMQERGERFVGRYKHSGNGSEYRSRLSTSFIESVGSNDAFTGGGDYDLAGGTGWLFAREELAGRFDYLFIDEAGQVSLADALAASLCASNVVMLGDPSQLAQVSQGIHPLHAGDSVLAHLLGEEETVPKGRGIFLDVSYRMQPEICAFISDAMYEGRLRPADSTRAHRISMPGHDFAGLYFVPIAHAGNGSSSIEEANEIVDRILQLRRHETNSAARDVIVVTPYNAQRRLIARRLRDAGIVDVPVGTVDKFQGQEASVVFYSMATSSGQDVPRNVEFLLERNRFNVAISRARAASILICSPRLLDIRCRTPEEMALANLLCEFAERATSVRARTAFPSA
jgi:predicted RecB family nuclease